MTQFCSCPRSTPGFKLTKVPGGSGLLNPSQPKALEGDPEVLSAPRKPSGCSFPSQPGRYGLMPRPGHLHSASGGFTDENGPDYLHCKWVFFLSGFFPWWYWRAVLCTALTNTCVLRTERLARYLGPNQLLPTCWSTVAFIPLPQFPCLCTTQCLAEMHAWQSQHVRNLSPPLIPDDALLPFPSPQQPSESGRWRQDPQHLHLHLPQGPFVPQKELLQRSLS